VLEASVDGRFEPSHRIPEHLKYDHFETPVCAADMSRALWTIRQYSRSSVVLVRWVRHLLREVENLLSAALS
jgi:hypothetical protein